MLAALLSRFRHRCRVDHYGCRRSREWARHRPRGHPDRTEPHTPPGAGGPRSVAPPALPTPKTAVTSKPVISNRPPRDRRTRDHHPRVPGHLGAGNCGWNSGSRTSPPAARDRRSSCAWVKSSTDTIAHHPIRGGSPEPHHMPGRYVIRVEQHLVPPPPAEKRIAGVTRVLQDRPHRAALPTVGQAVPVLIRPARGRTWDAVVVETVGNLPDRRGHRDTQRRSAAPLRPTSRRWPATRSRNPSATLRGFGCGPASTTW
jgi:hypothetical protein